MVASVTDREQTLQSSRPAIVWPIHERDRVKIALREVETELTKALIRFPEFNSPHEGKAVIEEELDELWQHVKANTGRTEDAMAEAIQIAAMALRYVVDLREDVHGIG